MYKLQQEELGLIQSLFENCEDTLVWSCLQGYMGEAWVDKIILECFKRGIEPHWDAANKASVALAEKLGYCLEKEYVTYEVNTQR